MGKYTAQFQYTVCTCKKSKYQRKRNTEALFENTLRRSANNTLHKDYGPEAAEGAAAEEEGAAAEEEEEEGEAAVLYLRGQNRAKQTAELTKPSTQVV